uniref:Uncharacterized protein n=1 Tax=Acanthochromis polyacanthus TaxID=80966 RepID=A0A3Q1FPJ6_9TELE
MNSQVRQNYHCDCTAAIHQTVNLEMFASEQFNAQLLAFIHFTLVAKLTQAVNVSLGGQLGLINDRIC